MTETEPASEPTGQEATPEEEFNIEKARESFTEFRRQVLEADEEGKIPAEMLPTGPVNHLKDIDPEGVTDKLLQIFTQTMKLRDKLRSGESLADNDLIFFQECKKLTTQEVKRVKDGDPSNLRNIEEFIGWLANLQDAIQSKDSMRRNRK